MWFGRLEENINCYIYIVSYVRSEISMYNSAAVFDKGFEPFQDESIMKSILAQYERVLVESLITTFGLDFIVKD